jgi:hypothetical protein
VYPSIHLLLRELDKTVQSDNKLAGDAYKRDQSEQTIGRRFKPEWNSVFSSPEFLVLFELGDSVLQELLRGSLVSLVDERALRSLGDDLMGGFEQQRTFG